MQMSSRPSYRSWAALVPTVLKEVASSGLWRHISSEVTAPVCLGNTEFGINVAPSADPAVDDYIIARLHELNLDHLRMDFSYCSVDGDAQRLLQRLIDDNQNVLLNLFPPADQAKRLTSDKAAADQWRDFLNAVFNRYGDQNIEFEVGSTPNRGRWSGLGLAQFEQMWRIAGEQAEAAGVAIAGPNVSDFEPMYSLGYLAEMKQSGFLPSVHTNNLFVERVVEPEGYDHRILGKWLEKPLAFNLIKKARVMQDIGRRMANVETYCTYTCWTNKRLERKANPDQKKVDYLVRYCVLAAASGALKRVYWGPLICGRDGIIHCGDENYPKIDNVAFHKRIRGSLTDFQITPAFHALRHVTAVLKGSHCEQGFSGEQGISHFILTRQHSDPTDSNETHIIWCRDGKTSRLDDLYATHDLDNAQFYNATGELLVHQPIVASEQPLFIEFSGHTTGQTTVQRPTPEKIANAKVNPGRWAAIANHQVLAIELPNWRGAIALHDGADLKPSIDRLTPEQLNQLPINKVLRDKRNRLWSIDDPNGADGEQLAVKLNRAQGIKKFTYRFTDSKAKRHWDNASYMLRCAVNTPEPVAYFERHQNSGIEHSYYLCRYLDNAFSARDIFTAFKTGQQEYRGFSKDRLLDEMGAFIYWMHDQRIVHRDLSSGNLMMTATPDGALKLYVIDIGRASLHLNKRLSSRRAFLDLSRICYKLNWADRATLINHYNRHSLKRSRQELPRWWRVPVYLYEQKQVWKKRIKGAFR